MAADFPCPACRKITSPTAAEPLLCPRCGCDLTELGKLAEAAARDLTRARLAFASGKTTEAARLATTSLHLRRTPAAQELLDLIT